MNITSSSLTIESLPDDPAALYRHYETQSQPQPALIVLDLETATLSASYDTEIGGAIPEAVYHGRVLTARLGAILTAQAATVLLAELGPAAQQVLAGASVTWENENRTGVLTAQARQAWEEITAAAAAADGPAVQGWQAAEWLGEGEPPAVNSNATDEELAVLARDITAEENAVFEDGYLHLMELDAYLRGRRDGTC